MPKTTDELLALKDRVYRDYADKVKYYILGKVTNEADAEDLHSIIFQKIFDKIDTYDEKKASVSTWVYTITHNTVCDYFKTKKNIVSLEDDVLAADENLDNICKKETLDELADALLKLKENERQIIVLVFYQDMTIKEAAAKIGMSYSNAKIVHASALAKLKDFLS
ncbi:MAG: sigma-70 family RNA polymerase sigma factor [Treponema sp.]|nr:sigma-70 family RNA polymerase sigma factor [Candidatus Treponema merdequi]